MADRVAAMLGGVPVELQIMSAADVVATAEHDATMNELAELLYEFDSPFVVDFSAYAATFGAAPTDIDTAIGETVRWFAGSAAQP